MCLEGWPCVWEKNDEGPYRGFRWANSGFREKNRAFSCTCGTRVSSKKETRRSTADKPCSIYSQLLVLRP